MKYLVASVLAIGFNMPALADTIAVDPSVLESLTVQEARYLTPLALSA
ncbi:MAG: hypothetical protein KDK08_15160 [Rhizobiaceae bacterium]|nr:hypothetical protein [Rhizobiaceae bacterium]